MSRRGNIFKKLTGGQPIHDLHHDGLQPQFRLSLQSTLPDHQNSPPLVTEFLDNPPVPLDIGRELLVPEILPRTWDGGHVAPMPMPEAAMHQDDSLILRKYNVWVAREVFRVESISEAKLVEGFSDLQFGGSVFRSEERRVG